MSEHDEMTENTEDTENAANIASGEVPKQTSAEPESTAEAVTPATPQRSADAATVSEAVPKQASAEPESTAAAAAAAAPQPNSASPAAKGRRELTATVLLALLGGIVAWTAAGRVWATGTAGEAPGAFPVSATGNDLSAAVTALGLTALAGALALLATRRAARRVVGLLLVAAGVGIAVNAVTARGASHASRALAEKAAEKHVAAGTIAADTASWWLLAVVGGVLVVAAGAAAVVRGGAWPGMSSRYENAAPRAARPAEAASAKDLWDALDRGEDPTDPAVPAASAAAATPGAEH